MSQPAQTLTIHHLSDIHIGRFHYQPAQPAFLHSTADRNLRRYINHLRRSRDDVLPHLVVLSGDFASYATEQELNSARDAIREIVAILESRSQRPRSLAAGQAPYAFIVPGNHDLDWGQDTYAGKI